MNDNNVKIKELQNILREMGNILVALSGGADSALLVHVAGEVLGKNALAVTLNSVLNLPGEVDDARRVAAAVGVEHRVITIEPLSIKEVADNNKQRCYACKKYLMSKLLTIAHEENIRWVVDGTNADDIHDYRPGMLALKELGIRSPLLEAGLSKEDVRRLSNQLGLFTADKPAAACLASRIPYGTTITLEKVRMVGNAEQWLKQRGFTQVRVRCHDKLARIEVPPNDIMRLADNFQTVAHALREMGFLYVTLDLHGYRTGSLNEEI